MENVEIVDSGKKGKGIFALKDIKKGEEILIFFGTVVEVEDESKYSKFIREHWHPIDIRGNNIVYVLPETPWMYLNHSCKPNAGVKDDRYLVALEFIAMGKEINIDYSTLFLNDWSMECECGNSNCRKLILTFDTLNTEDKERLKDYTSSYVRKRYLRD